MYHYLKLLSYLHLSIHPLKVFLDIYECVLVFYFQLFNSKCLFLQYPVAWLHSCLQKYKCNTMHILLWGWMEIKAFQCSALSGNLKIPLSLILWFDTASPILLLKIFISLSGPTARIMKFLHLSSLTLTTFLWPGAVLCCRRL